MPSTRVAALACVAALVLLAVFQIALACGAPLGRFAMGGAFEGTYPPAMRVAAIAQVLIYVAMGAVILARANVILPRLKPASRVLIWLVVAIGLVATVLNLITPSEEERLIWAPVALILLLASARIAMSKAS